jgi:hypothetical protein
VVCPSFEPLTPIETLTTARLYAVYYRIFTADGAIPSNRPADEQNPWLGCIEAVHITPPQTVASIIRCMCKVEQIARFHFAKLFLFDATAVQMDEKEALSILSGSGPGSDITRPLALVLGPTSDVFTTPIMAKHGICMLHPSITLCHY